MVYCAKHQPAVWSASLSQQTFSPIADFAQNNRATSPSLSMVVKSHFDNRRVFYWQWVLKSGLIQHEFTLIAVLTGSWVFSVRIY